MLSQDIDVNSEEPITGASGNTKRTTGTEIKDKLNNIFDLLGNSYEWTLEANKTNLRSQRGGSQYESEAPNIRTSANPTMAFSDSSSRLSLCLTPGTVVLWEDE
jgi:hypothetical protein